VSAVKSTVDGICQKLQEHDDEVDLSSLSPHVVTGILKSSLRQVSYIVFSDSCYIDIFFVFLTYFVAIFWYSLFSAVSVVCHIL